MRARACVSVRIGLAHPVTLVTYHGHSAHSCREFMQCVTSARIIVCNMSGMEGGTVCRATVCSFCVCSVFGPIANGRARLEQNMLPAVQAYGLQYYYSATIGDEAKETGARA